jgi:thiol-disulfide isomerase/thioredoxin
MINQKINNYLENSKDMVNGIFRDKKLILLIVILIIIFTIVFFFVYNNYIKNFISKNHSLNKEFVSKEDKAKNASNDVLIMFFYTEWCPYCKQALPEIKKFEDYIISENTKNDYIITLTKIDCDKNSTIADKYKVESYPTIKLIYKGEVYNYDAKPNRNNLIKFVETSIA